MLPFYSYILEFKISKMFPQENFCFCLSVSLFLCKFKQNWSSSIKHIMFLIFRRLTLKFGTTKF